MDTSASIAIRFVIAFTLLRNEPLPHRKPAHRGQPALTDILKGSFQMVGVGGFYALRCAVKFRCKKAVHWHSPVDLFNLKCLTFMCLTPMRRSIKDTFDSFFRHSRPVSQIGLFFGELLYEFPGKSPHCHPYHLYFVRSLFVA